jgi:nucleoside-diphosphate-sugar epimerase
LLEGVALRYFNVFGPRQDPNGPYAAIVPSSSRGDRRDADHDLRRRKSDADFRT